MNKKGKIGAAVWIISLLIVVVVAGSAVWYFAGQTAAVVPYTPTAAVEYDGEFRDAGLADDVVGGDLIADVAYSEDSDTDEWNISLDTTTNLSTTSGLPYTFAVMFEVGSGGFEGLEIDGELGTNITTDEGVFSNVYVMKDEKGKILSSANALSNFELDLDSDLDQWTLESTGPVDKGNYILVMDFKTLVPVVGTPADGGEIVKVTLKADTDGDLDEGIIYLENSG